MLAPVWFHEKRKSPLYQGRRTHLTTMVRLPTVPKMSTVGNTLATFPVCLWLTGLPASGKTTLSEALEKALKQDGLSVVVLDGDCIRAALSPQLGYSRVDRHANVVRIAHLAVESLSHADVVIVAAVSPYRDARDEARAIVGAAGIFLEVHVDTPVETCIRRDPKGLYAKALAGEIVGFTGVDGTYERPRDPEVHVSREPMGMDEAVACVLAKLSPVLRSAESEWSISVIGNHGSCSPVWGEAQAGLQSP